VSPLPELLLGGATNSSTEPIASSKATLWQSRARRTLSPFRSKAQKQYDGVEPLSRCKVLRCHTI